MGGNEHRHDFEAKPSDEYVEDKHLNFRIEAIRRLHDGQDHGGDHRLVVDIKEAEREYGVQVASALKTTEDGSCILWPQPRDDPNDPLNVSLVTRWFEVVANSKII